MYMALKGPYTLTVEHDDDVFSPRRDGENFGTMVCFHRRYDLGDSHTYADKDEFLRDLFIRAVGGGTQGEERYERLIDRIAKRNGASYGSYALAYETDKALMERINRSYVTLPLYLYDHSGLAMNTTGFHDPWDSGQVGLIYVSKADVLQEYGAERFSDALRQKAEHRLRSEVEDYDSYLRGECYGYELYKNEELVDSCWGFIGSFEDACKEIEEYLPDECSGMTAYLAETNRTASMVKTLLRHARIKAEQTAKDFSHTPQRQAMKTR